MLLAALEAEVAAYLEAHRDERDAEGHALVVRNGKGRTRKVMVGSGTIPVSAPRVNDQRIDRDGERRRFTSRILPPYMRRSPKVAEVLPVLYLRGLSTGDFREALATLLGDDAARLSATNIARLTNEWETEYRAFLKRSLTDRDYVYVWVDGVHFNVRLEDDHLCTLVMIGVRRTSAAPRARGHRLRGRRQAGGKGQQAEGEGGVTRDHPMPAARESISTIHSRESPSFPGHSGPCYGWDGERRTKP